MAAKPLPVPPDEPETNAGADEKPSAGPPNRADERRASTEGGGPIKVGPGTN